MSMYTEIAKEFNKDMIIGVEESISIKEESVTTSTKKKNKKTESTIDSDVFDINNGTTDDVSIDEKVVEVNRILRTREDGSSYHEIEYSDGSMTEEFYQQ